MSETASDTAPEPAGAIAERRSLKRASAFRTIGEVAEEVDLPAHVLRFWESKFPQLKPLKRGGGRRYYRPEDIVLLRRIRQCLYQDGYTIRGVQKLLREGGVRSVVSVMDAGDAELPDFAAPSDFVKPREDFVEPEPDAIDERVPSTLFPLRSSARASGPARRPKLGRPLPEAVPDRTEPPTTEPDIAAPELPPTRDMLLAALKEARRELLETRVVLVALRGRIDEF